MAVSCYTYKRGLRRQGSRLHRIKSQLCPRWPVFI